MKDTSITARSKRSVPKSSGREVARVDALAHFDARVCAQPPVDLVVADIDGDDAPRAVLQEAVGEAAGRGAHVETRQAAHV